MSVERLHEVIGAVGSPPPPIDLAETLWLACMISERVREAPPARRHEAEPVGVPSPASPPPAVPDKEEPPAEPAKPLPEDIPPDPRPEKVFTIRQAATVGEPALEVPVPEALALDDRLNFQRALRPLHRRVRGRRLEVLDEDATARIIAGQGRPLRLWPPVFQPSTERWLDAALVVDAGASMRIWASIADEVGGLIKESGIFRRLSVAYLADAGEGRAGLTDGYRSQRRVADLLDPSGRRVTFVLSDCVGRIWHSGSAAGLLHRWSVHGPVAILQPLPERMWFQTGAATLAGRLHSARRGSANADLRFHALGGMEQPPGSAVPVLELSPAWLRRWTQLVAGRPSSVAAVTFVQPAKGGPREVAPRRTSSPQDVRQRVRYFRTVASPEAVRLAAYVALSEPTLPVIRHIHRAMFAPAHSSHLAEFLLSGLLRVVDAEAGAYEFVDGAADLLMETLTRHEFVQAADVLRAGVSRSVEGRVDRAGPKFRGLVGGRGDAFVPATTAPFAALTPGALHRWERLVRRPPVAARGERNEGVDELLADWSRRGRVVAVGDDAGCLVDRRTVLACVAGFTDIPIVRAGGWSARAVVTARASDGTALLMLDQPVPVEMPMVGVGRIAGSQPRPCHVYTPDAIALAWPGAPGRPVQ
jgi:hypothetical protein